MKDGSIKLSQRALMDTIIKDADLKDSKVKAVLAKVNEHLHAHLDKPPFSLNFNYGSMIGKLNYLAQTTRPDIMYATHQLAKYSSNPREPHGDAALYLVQYLKKSRDIGIRFQPDPTKGFECYCDAVLRRCPRAGGGLVREILLGFLMRERCKWGDSNR
jgi:hypothetical protein